MTRHLLAARRRRAFRRAAFLGAPLHFRSTHRTSLLLEQLEARVPPGSMLVSSVADASGAPAVPPSSRDDEDRGQPSQEPSARDADAQVPQSPDPATTRAERLHRWLRDGRVKTSDARQVRSERDRDDVSEQTEHCPTSRKEAASAVDVGFDADLHDDLLDFLAGRRDDWASRGTPPPDPSASIGSSSRSGTSPPTPALPLEPTRSDVSARAPQDTLPPPRWNSTAALADRFPSLPQLAGPRSSVPTATTLAADSDHAAHPAPEKA